MTLPAPDEHGRYRFPDGRLVAPPNTVSASMVLLPLPVPPLMAGPRQWIAVRPDGTPLRDGDLSLRRFDTPEAAAAALAERP